MKKTTFCPKCNHKLGDKAHYCPICGPERQDNGLERKNDPAEPGVPPDREKPASSDGEKSRK
ncbi:hypothetical protein C4J81_14585 [Deltaproteobacteria bacterium Smac51]|nr:hypothetical protein C4J81_14585 [Deltaproteobacteria bacterium Smac51]